MIVWLKHFSTRDFKKPKPSLKKHLWKPEPSLIPYYLKTFKFLGEHIQEHIFFTMQVTGFLKILYERWSQKTEICCEQVSSLMGKKKVISQNS